MEEDHKDIPALENDLIQLLLDAKISAEMKNHSVVMPIHLLLAIVYNQVGEDLIRSMGVDPIELSLVLENKLDNGQYNGIKGRTSSVKVGNSLGLALCNLQRRIQSNGSNDKISVRLMTELLFNNLRNILSHIPTFKDETVKYDPNQPYIAVAADFADAVSAILDKLNRPVVPGNPKPVPVKPGTETETGYTVRKGGPLLQQFCDNLTEKAFEGKIDPLIGRKKEIARAMQILTRRDKNNAVFVGDPGVGKTAMAKGLARQIVEGDVPEKMKGITLLSLNMGTVVAGTKFRGEFEERMQGILKEIEEMEKQGHKVILFIDEIHTVIGAGKAEGSMDASNLLKPALANGLRCLGATTYNEYRKHIEKDGALSRRFQKIDINEPSLEETVEILEGLKGLYEEAHDITYSKETIKAIAALAAKYMHERKLPDKAIDLMDEVGAERALHPRKGPNGKEISIEDAEETVAMLANIPDIAVTGDDLTRLKKLRDDLEAAVFDQPEAIEALVKAVKRSRAGLSDPKKPVGSYLFPGPTGVGKTETAKQLAATMGVKLIRLDMSEYSEKHNVSRLVGSPPGYVGYDEAGQLTNAVRQNPHCVLLLDEIEKAHPDVFNILLQIMDDGRLTDSHGRTVDFSNVTLIMTTNAGTDLLEKTKTIGISSADDNGDSSRKDGEDRVKEALKDLFKPEFRNRLNAIIIFHPLLQETMVKIAGKFLKQLGERLKERNVEMRVSDKAMAYLAKEGYDPTMGARPLDRLIETRIEDSMVDELLFGKLKKGGQVDVDLEESKDGENVLSFTFTSATKLKKPEKKKEPVSAPPASNDNNEDGPTAVEDKPAAPAP